MRSYCSILLWEVELDVEVSSSLIVIVVMDKFVCTQRRSASPLERDKFRNRSRTPETSEQNKKRRAEDKAAVSTLHSSYTYTWWYFQPFWHSYQAAWSFYFKVDLFIIPWHWPIQRFTIIIMIISSSCMACTQWTYTPT